MSLELLLTILIFLIIGIIVIKAIRKILTIILSLVLLYFAYYTFMTYPGAVKFALFQKTFNFNSYRIDMEDYYKEGNFDFSENPIELDKDKIISLSCKNYKPIVLCEAKVESED